MGGSKIKRRANLPDLKAQLKNVALTKAISTSAKGVLAANIQVNKEKQELAAQLKTEQERTAVLEEENAKILEHLDTMRQALDCSQKFLERLEAIEEENEHLRARLKRLEPWEKHLDGARGADASGEASGAEERSGD